jgi:Zn-dependent peptidase ImmA (M78 family)
MWGLHFPTLQEIKVDSEVREDRKVNILIHELLHALYERYGLEDGEKEEAVVESLANGLSALFKDNPKLVDYIKEGVR